MESKDPENQYNTEEEEQSWKTTLIWGLTIRP